MIDSFKNFTRGFTIFSVVILLISLAVYLWMPFIHITPAYPYVVLFFYGFTLIVFRLLNKTKERRLSKFANAYMLVNFGKLVFFTIIIFIQLNTAFACRFALRHTWNCGRNRRCNTTGTTACSTFHSFTLNSLKIGKKKPGAHIKSTRPFLRLHIVHCRKNSLLLAFVTLSGFFNHIFSNILRTCAIVRKFHGELTTTRSHSTQITNITKHFTQRNIRFNTNTSWS